MKKYILSLMIILALVIVTGCGKGVKEKDEETGKDKTVYKCVKKGIERKNSVTGKPYTLDVTNTAKLDDDKLVYYSTLNHYTLETKDECEDSCSAAKEWNDEINDKEYAGGHRVTTCKCDSKEYTEEFIYDDIPNLDSILRSDIKELKNNNTFELDKWLEKYEKIKYNCN